MFRRDEMTDSIWQKWPRIRVACVSYARLRKGILERDLETLIPDPDREILMYCGGGYRSVLTCDAAQKMGYRKVQSLIGGYKGMVAAGWPVKKGD